MIRNEDKGRQAEVVWTFLEESREYEEKRVMEMKLPEKKKKGGRREDFWM